MPQGHIGLQSSLGLLASFEMFEFLHVEGARASCRSVLGGSGMLPTPSHARTGGRIILTGSLRDFFELGSAPCSLLDLTLVGDASLQGGSLLVSILGLLREG